MILKWADHVLLISYFGMEIFYLSFTAENATRAGENIVKTCSNFLSYPNLEVIQFGLQMKRGNYK